MKNEQPRVKIVGYIFRRERIFLHGSRMVVIRHPGQYDCENWIVCLGRLKRLFPCRGFEMTLYEWQDVESPLLTELPKAHTTFITAHSHGSFTVFLTRSHTSSHFLPSGRFLLLSLSTSFCASTFLCPSLTGPTILLLTSYLSPCAAHIQTLNVVVATSLLTNSPPPPPQLLLFITRYVLFCFFRWKEWVSTVQPLI